MPARIEYKSSVYDDLRVLDRAVAERIIDEPESILSEDPDHGEPLSREFRGLPKYRAREYRFIYTRLKDSVLVLRIGLRTPVDR